MMHGCDTLHVMVQATRTKLWLAVCVEMFLLALNVAAAALLLAACVHVAITPVPLPVAASLIAVPVIFSIAWATAVRPGAEAAALFADSVLQSNELITSARWASLSGADRNLPSTRRVVDAGVRLAREHVKGIGRRTPFKPGSVFALITIWGAMTVIGVYATEPVSAKGTYVTQADGQTTHPPDTQAQSASWLGTLQVRSLAPSASDVQPLAPERDADNASSSALELKSGELVAPLDDDTGKDLMLTNAVSDATDTVNPSSDSGDTSAGNRGAQSADITVEISDLARKSGLELVAGESSVELENATEIYTVTAAVQLGELARNVNTEFLPELGALHRALSRRYLEKTD